MNKRSINLLITSFILAFVFAAHAMADDVVPNIPITANQAFDAVVEQVDPIDGTQASVALIDVRTAAEYFWVGACAKVNSISTKKREYLPYNGKVELKWGKYLFFKVERKRGLRRVVLPVKRVTEVISKEISLHIPFLTWNEDAVGMDANLDFNEQIESLADTYDVLILMCRSGKRSDYTGFDRSLFAAVYEIDQPDGSTGKGGFQGSSYSDDYIGYRGYPGRNTRWQSSRSVSWSDAGLPVKISKKPTTVVLPEIDADGDPMTDADGDPMTDADGDPI